MPSNSPDDRPRDAVGRRRSPATLPEHRRGQAPGNKGQRTGGQIYEASEILRLLDAIPTSAPVHIRDRALFVFLWRSGVKLTELERVRLMDLDESAGTVHIRRSENRPSREVRILGSRDVPDWGWREMRPWIDKRAERGIVRSAPLFCTITGPSKGGDLGTSQVRVSLKKHAKKAQLHGNFNLAGFRNTLAVEMLEAGVSIAGIQRHLGHDSLATTQGMLERLGVIQKYDDLRNYRPGWSSRRNDR